MYRIYVSALHGYYCNTTNMYYGTTRFGLSSPWIRGVVFLHPRPTGVSPTETKKDQREIRKGRTFADSRITVAAGQHIGGYAHIGGHRAVLQLFHLQ